MKELFSPQEVAQILDVHVKTVRRYLREGVLKGQKIGGGWKISKDELSRYMDQVIPESIKEVHDERIIGEGKIRRCLIIEIDVKSQVEANKYANALMELINSNQYSNCKFQYHLEQGIAKFVLTGSKDYLNEMMTVIERLDNEI